MIYINMIYKVYLQYYVIESLECILKTRKRSRRYMEHKPYSARCPCNVRASTCSASKRSRPPSSEPHMVVSALSRRFGADFRSKSRQFARF